MISEPHADILRELVNIGFGRAAAALSELTGRQVLLEVPSLTLVAAAELHPVFRELIPGKVAAVHQAFSGSFAGDALLVISYDAAAGLSDLMTETHERPHGGLDESDGEVLSEIGNILLNAFVGSFGNLLQARVLLSVPGLYIDRLEALLESVLQQRPEPQALVITTNFRLRAHTVSGYVVMIFNVHSLEKLFAALDGMT